jgi:hypothetical protein
MTNPYRQNRPNATPKPANDEQPQPSIDDMIAGLFGKRSANSFNSSADFDANFPGSADCSPHGQTTGSSSQRQPLQGGEFSDTVALDLLNSHFMVGKSKNETAIFQINDDGTISFVPTEEFKLAVQNIFVKKNQWQAGASREILERKLRPARASTGVQAGRHGATSRIQFVARLRRRTAQGMAETTSVPAPPI